MVFWRENGQNVVYLLTAQERIPMLIKDTMYLLVAYLCDVYIRLIIIRTMDQPTRDIS